MKATAKEGTARRRGPTLDFLPAQLLSVLLSIPGLALAAGLAPPQAHARRNKPVAQASKPAGKTAVKPAGKPTNKTASKAANRTTSKATGETTGKAASNTTSRAADKTTSKTGKTANKTASKAATKATRRAANKTANKSATSVIAASAGDVTPAVAANAIALKTEPRAVVWLDEVRRGVADESGRLVIAQVAPRRQRLRVRASGFAERTLSLRPAQRGALLLLPLTRSTDAAELAFQQAEESRERAASDDARREVAELYRRALRLRPRFADAHVGLARVLLDLNDYEGALEEVEEARKDRPNFAEASAVEGRILRASSQNAEAVAAYGRAIREARGFQPEAHTGLGIVYEEEGKYEEAATAYRTAVAQLSDTEPVLYELLGRVYERLEKYKEAVAAYEKYLALAPHGKLAPAVQSVIEQLRKQAAEQPR